MLPHYPAKVRCSSFGIFGRKCRQICNILWFLNTHLILMHLTYLLTCFFNFCSYWICFANSRRFYLNKCCKLKQRFLHVWHGIDQTVSLTMQLMSGVDIFAHVCGQKADISSNYCDNIQPHDKRRFSFCQCVTIFWLFFWKLPQFHTWLS